MPTNGPCKVGPETRLSADLALPVRPVIVPPPTDYGVGKQMKPDHLKYLVCPRTGRALQLDESCVLENGCIKQGTLSEPVSRCRYPIVDFIPRFVARP